MIQNVLYDRLWNRSCCVLIGCYHRCWCSCHYFSTRSSILIVESDFFRHLHYVTQQLKHSLRSKQISLCLSMFQPLSLSLSDANKSYTHNSDAKIDGERERERGKRKKRGRERQTETQNEQNKIATTTENQPSTGEKKGK